ncbi:MAG TPA: HK97 family phage prohead protease [Aeromicrobium sp.]|nr:HK97 family phage prohead protease [Aeromicrobium sp.]HKY57534.1 HK97 family phage prohead protease [Aeromicrobium sp.]
MTASIDEQKRLARPPLEGLRRESPFRLRAAEDGASDGLTLDGYAAVFNRETVIDSWEGRFKEKIAPGAMKRSFRETPPRVQFDHGHHPLIGSIPIAALERGYPKEEVDPDLAPEGGAHVLARLHDNWLVQPVRDAIASESIDGMSFRFAVLQEDWHDADGKKVTDPRTLRDLLQKSWMDDLPDEELLVRTLRQLKVPELGPVVWPAYTDTSVGVRSQTITIDLARLNEADQRNMLAQAVLLADRVDAETQGPTDEAEVHVEVKVDAEQIRHTLQQMRQRFNDTQRATEKAGEHESATAHYIKGFLAEVRAINHKADSTKERYS